MLSYSIHFYYHNLCRLICTISIHFYIKNVRHGYWTKCSSICQFIYSKIMINISINYKAWCMCVSCVRVEHEASGVQEGENKVNEGWKRSGFQ
jgi:hypothetical protein